MFESKSGILGIAGLLFFGIAFLSNAVIPVMMYRNLPEQTAEQLVNANIRYQFEDLARRYPESFEETYGKAPAETKEREAWLNQKCADTLRLGRTVYIAEACWHCHSQFVRPVSNEDRRWGAVSKSNEYANELQRPVMFGTRRVGPDLCREGGRRSNDWHAIHFFRPLDLSVKSPMPEYPWFFKGASNKPNARGLAIITYVQWLGSWHETYPLYEQYEASSLKDVSQTDAKAADAALAASAPEKPAAEAPAAAAPPAAESPAAPEKPAEPEPKAKP